MPDQKALLLVDNFAAHSSGDVIQPLEDNGVLVEFLPSNTTDRLQPLDLSINKPTKDFLIGKNSGAGMYKRFLRVFRMIQKVKLCR